MNLSTKVVCGAVLFALAVLAQPIPVYNSYEEYCQQNPHAKATTSAPQTVVAPSPARTEETLPRAHSFKKGSPTDIRLGQLDWRLVEPNADLLIGINMASLVESESARTLIRQWTGKLGATTWRNHGGAG